MPSLPDLTRTIQATIADLLPRVPAWEALPADSADRCACLALQQMGTSIHFGPVQALPYQLTLRDHAGQHRPLYRCMFRIARIRCCQREMSAEITPYTDLVPARWHSYAAALRDPQVAVPADQITPTSHGTFTNVSPETTQDAFIYDDLSSIHALFGIAAKTKSPPLIATLRRAVSYHVENTQSDYVTSAHPFAIAAFAMLDDTATFAAQQLHDLQCWYATHPGPVSGISLFLLADAVEQLHDASAV